MLAPPITRANAADYARRAHASRARNQRALHDRIADLENQLAIAHAQGAAIARELPALDINQQHARVEHQITALSKRLDGMLADGHPKAIEMLARALASLREQERILAGRPLPGSLRPKPSRNGSPGPADRSAPRPVSEP